ncbi:ThiF family adenylyltransferase [Brumimicrobium mesophilum]|uniref:ThiF family adenylyltransferase n=1 Tax=Brumimicrobium mesophilum TaxID=392717 RepID=UPI000D140A69|nr:ThiF family adenylyltransferase [Brumimicrobium mesophilum]
MSTQLIDHNEDLKRLKDEGFVLEFRPGYLLVHRIPYFNLAKEIKYGILVIRLHLAGDKTIKNIEHTAFFVGEAPCDRNGAILNNILNNSNKRQLFDNLVADHYFSAKPQINNGKYKDHYEKVSTYVGLISSHPKSVDSNITEKGNKIINSSESSVFNYLDTNSNKPELSSLNSKFREQKIGIIGLGGTGSYLLDLICKVPVKEIHIFDGDWFYNNNAFRAPGAPSKEELISPQKKTSYFYEIYSKMNNSIIEHDYYVTNESLKEFDDFNFVFLCVDRGNIRKEVVKYLESKNISFIDIGMGINKIGNSLGGMLRVTASTPKKRNHVWDKNRIPFSDDLENEYNSNIQIAELNCLNATLAVIKWKKLLGYYQDTTLEYNSFYLLGSNHSINEDKENES